MRARLNVHLWLATTILLLVSAACSSGPRGGTGPEGMVGPLALEPPPVYALLGYRAELDLSSEQVAALDSIAQVAQDETEPLLEELREKTGGPRGATRYDPAEEPLVAEIRASHQRVSEAVGAVLTEEQRQSVCRLFDRSRGAGRGGSQRRPPAAQAAGDTLRAGGPMPTWNWCGPRSDDPAA